MTAPTAEPRRLRYLDAPERRRRILHFLRESGFGSVTRLATDLDVSDMTIRRDLRLLERAGDVRVVHGGASLRHGTLQTPGFVARAGTQAEAKRRLAGTASATVNPGDAIALDSGSTCYALAAALAESGFAGTVVTHSVPVVQLMLHHRDVRVIGLGGDLVHESQAFVGALAVEQLARLRVRTTFLGAVALDDRGVYVNEDVEVPTKSALMAVADQVVLMLDGSKLARSAPVRLCPLDQVSHLITDRKPPRQLAQRLATDRVRVTIAP